ncbi:MAG: hypothetical protein O3C45_00025 [Bacteroidetes bacterium]|nr:hypothetical protein [Bacteroidota bacterium]
MFTPRILTATCLVAAWSLLVAGCATPRRTATPAVTDHVETVAFTSMADRVDIVDQATSALISANFAITLANDRIGLVQSDFIPLSRVQTALADSLPPVADFSNILLRVAVNAERGTETKYVQVKGTFQRIAGAPRTTDDLVGLYWLEQLTARMARGVDAEFVHQVSDSTYARLLTGSQPQEEEKSPGISGAIKVAGILVAVLFVVQLASGAFGPVSSPTPSQ